MNSTLQIDPGLSEASLRFDCRPAWRWANCGPDYSNSIRIFYWVFFGIHLLSTLGALAFAVKTFCICGKRRQARTYGRTSLRIFTSFCIAGFCGSFARKYDGIIGIGASDPTPASSNHFSMNLKILIWDTKIDGNLFELIFGLL
jgi:hypothetical protein